MVNAEAIWPKADGDTHYGSDVNRSSKIISVLAGENLTANDAVYIKQSDGKAYKSDTGTADDIRFSGFAMATTTSGNSVQVQCAGRCTGFSSLTSGAVYYIGATGAIATTKNNVPVGVADSTTTVVIIPLEISSQGASPIGSVTAWLKSYTNTPALPAGWVECNGQTLSDADSLFNGQVIPNLNASGSGDKRFLRGSTTSGTTGGAETHTHGTTSHEAEDPAATAIDSIAAANHLPPYYEVVFIMRVK